jgi:DNA-binding NarL/FixJ family response regulator
MLMYSLRTNARSSTPPGNARKLPESHRLHSRGRLSRVGECGDKSGQARSRGPCKGGAIGDVIHPRGEPRRSILCVEDEQETASLLADGLTELGYAVELAPDGEVGFAKILANRPDLVLCDFWMPRMGGLELLQQLSEAGPQYAALPFILLTGQRDRDSELAGRRLGADDCLTKPVDFEMLGVVVENRLRRVGGRAALRSQIHLTNREKDVLTWVGRGKTSAEIAIILGLSERTVNFHCEQAMKRLDVVNRTQAVAKALAEGLIGT